MNQPIRHAWLGLFIKDLETNPKTQYKVHLWGAIYWLINFPMVVALFFLFPKLWLQIGVFITLVYSIYANFSTDYGAMSSAMAAQGGKNEDKRQSNGRTRTKHAKPEEA